MKTDKKLTIEETIAALEKKYDKGVVLVNDGTESNVRSVSTGCYAIDGLLGCGGLPMGRIIEIYGQESSGKSTLCFYFAAQVQKQGGKVVYLDVEQTYDKKYAGSVGVDTDALIVSQPTTVEETLDIMRAFVATDEIDLIVLDSVAAMVPKADLVEGALEKDSIAMKARSMSRCLPIVAAEVSKSNTICLFINQTRSNIGVYYGPKDVTPGGKALKFYSSVRLSVTRGEAIKDGTEQIGNVLKIVAKKNKVGFPFREGTVELYYGSGVDLVSDTFIAGVEYGVINKKGNTYEFDGTKLGVGKDQVKAFLREESAVYDSLREAIDTAIAGGQVRDGTDGESDETETE